MKLKSIITTVLATVLFAGFADAQVTGQGNFMMGGTIGFSTAESRAEITGGGLNVQNEGTRATQFNITPAIGYFLLDNWALGIGMDYTLNRLREPIDVSDPDTEYETSFDSDLLFGPFTRYYFPIGTDKAFFLEASAGFGSSQNEAVVNGEQQTLSNNVFLLGVGPGFTIFSTDAIGIEALVQYNWARSSADIDFQGVSTETKTYTSQVDFSIGFQVYFARMQPAGTYDRSTNPNGDFY